jgi:hypothetical protein
MRPFGILCSFDLAGRGSFGTRVVAARRRFSSVLGLGGDLSALIAVPHLARLRDIPAGQAGEADITAFPLAPGAAVRPSLPSPCA